MSIFFRKPKLVHMLQVKPGFIVQSIAEYAPSGKVYGYIAGEFRDELYTGQRATDTVFCPDIRPRFRESVTTHVPSVYVDSGNNYLTIGKISLSRDTTQDAYKHSLMKGDRVLKPRFREELMRELLEYHLRHQELPVFEIPKAGTYTLAQLNRFLRMKR